MCFDVNEKAGTCFESPGVKVSTLLIGGEKGSHVFLLLFFCKSIGNTASDTTKLSPIQFRYCTVARYTDTNESKWRRLT